MLTTGVDTPPGTTGVDVITGSITNLDGTLQVTDVINGAEGVDQMLLSQSADFSGFTTGSVKNVETVTITNSSASARSFDMKSFTGVKTLNISSKNSDYTLTNLNTGLTSLSFEAGSRARDLIVSYETVATERTGTTDALTFTLSNVGRVDPLVATGDSFERTELTLNEVEALSLNLAGTNFARLMTASEVSAVTLTGDGSLNLDLDTAYTQLRSVDGSAAKGALTLDLSNGPTTGVMTSVKTGIGNDSITLAREGLTQNAVIAAGSGTNSLTLSSANGAAAKLVQYDMSGIQTLNLRAVTETSGTGHATNTLTFSGTKTSGLETITSRAATATDIVFSGMGTSSLKFVSQGSTVQNGSISSDHSGTTIVNYDALGTTAKAGGTAETPLVDYTFSESTGVTVNVGGNLTLAAGATVTASKATSVSLNVASSKTPANLENTTYSGSIVAPKATSVTVTASGKLTDAVIDAVQVTGLTLVNGTNAATLRLDSGTTTNTKLKAMSITTEADLTLRSSDGAANVALAGLQTLTIDAKKGHVQLFDDAGTAEADELVFAKMNTVNISGSGSTSRVTLNDLGGDNGYGLTVTATGLKGGAAGDATPGLTIDNIEVSVGETVNLNLVGTVGAVKIGTISAPSTGNAGAVTIKASGVGSFNTGVTNSVSIDNITSSGAVSVDLSGTRAPSIGTIKGSSVVLDLSNVTTSATVGDITASKSANINYFELGTNTRTISAASDTSTFNVTVNGGAAQDQITIAATGAVVSSVVVTGDLKGATNDTIDVSASGALAKSVNISGLLNYENSTITGGAGADTITGGVGADTIRAGAGANVLDGGAGADIFQFGTGGTVSTLAAGESKISQIVNLQAVDQIVFNDSAIKKAGDAVETQTDNAAVTGASAKVTILATGAVLITGATATGFDTLTDKVALVDEAVDKQTSSVGMTAYFLHEGTVYMYINNVDDDGVSYAGATVVKLTGISTLPGVAPTDGVTGLIGVGA